MGWPLICSSTQEVPASEGAPAFPPQAASKRANTSKGIKILFFIILSSPHEFCL
jgi:hypothetical protein